MIKTTRAIFLRCTDLRTKRAFSAWDGTDDVVTIGNDTRRLQRYLVRAMYRARLVPRHARVNWLRFRNSGAVEAIVGRRWHVVAAKQWMPAQVQGVTPCLVNAHVRPLRLVLPRRVWLQPTTEIRLIWNDGEARQIDAVVVFWLDSHCYALRVATTGFARPYAGIIHIRHWKADEREKRTRPPYRARVLVPWISNHYWGRLDKLPNKTGELVRTAAYTYEQIKQWTRCRTRRADVVGHILRHTPELIQWMPAMSSDHGPPTYYLYKFGKRLIGRGVELPSYTGEAGTEELIFLENPECWEADLEKILFQ